MIKKIIGSTPHKATTKVTKSKIKPKLSMNNSVTKIHTKPINKAKNEKMIEEWFKIFPFSTTSKRHHARNEVNSMGDVSMLKVSPTENNHELTYLSKQINSNIDILTNNNNDYSSLFEDDSKKNTSYTTLTNNLLITKKTNNSRFERDEISNIISTKSNISEKKPSNKESNLDTNNSYSENNNNYNISNTNKANQYIFNYHDKLPNNSNENQLNDINVSNNDIKPSSHSGKLNVQEINMQSLKEEVSNILGKNLYKDSFMFQIENFNKITDLILTNIREKKEIIKKEENNDNYCSTNSVTQEDIQNLGIRRIKSNLEISSILHEMSTQKKRIKRDEIEINFNFKIPKIPSALPSGKDRKLWNVGIYERKIGLGNNCRNKSSNTSFQREIKQTKDKINKLSNDKLNVGNEVNEIYSNIFENIFKTLQIIPGYIDRNFINLNNITKGTFSFIHPLLDVLYKTNYSIDKTKFIELCFIILSQLTTKEKQKFIRIVAGSEG